MLETKHDLASPQKGVPVVTDPHSVPVRLSRALPDTPVAAPSGWCMLVRATSTELTKRGTRHMPPMRTSGGSPASPAGDQISRKL
jgi:hypothetical protein